MRCTCCKAHTPEDITHYSENELSLRVYNTETLYKIRYSPNLETVLKEYFIFTHAQMGVLLGDLANEDEG